MVGEVQEPLADELRERHRRAVRGRQVPEGRGQELAKGKTSIDLASTDITWLLYARHISWRYYVQAGVQPDCDNDSAETCAAVKQNVQTPGIWNPLPLFGDCRPTIS